MRVLELGVGVEVCAFDVFEIAVGVDLEFAAGVFVANYDGVPVHLQCGDGPLLGDAAFHTVLQGAGFVVAADHQEHFFGGHDCADSYG